MARSKAGFFPVKTLNGAPPAIMNMPLVATAYYEGNVLRLSGTSGSGRLAAAAGTSIAGVIACNVSNGSSSSGKWPVYLPDNNTIFEVKALASLASQAQVGEVYDIAVATTYNYRMQGTASTKVLSVVGVHPDEAEAAGTGKRFWVKFARSVWADTKSDQSK